MGTIRVILESPFASSNKLLHERNKLYLELAMRDCLYRGEAPFASHKLYTACLNDDDPHERSLGITSGFAWRSAATKTVVYVDLGVSTGMRLGIADAQTLGMPIEYRRLPGWSGERVEGEE